MCEKLVDMNEFSGILPTLKLKLNKKKRNKKLFLFFIQFFIIYFEI